MAKTMVQQSQISGSLEFNDTLAAGSSLAGKQSLVGDLDALRSQINKIIGGDHWYDALSGSQDLADIYAAVHMSGANADFQGTLDVTGVATFDAAITGSMGLQLGGDLYVTSTADFQGAVNLQSTLDVGGDAHFTGAIVDVDGTLSASVIKIDGDSPAGALYLVGAAGEIAEEGKLVFSNDSLDITGALDVSGVVDAGELYVGGPTGLSGTLAVNGVSDFAADVYMAADLYVSGAMEVAQGLTVTGDRLEVTGSMGVTGAVDFDSTLNVDGIADFKADVFMAANLGVSGSLTVAQDIDAVNVTLTGDLSAVSGSFSGDLDVDGDLTAYKISIDGDVAQRLYIVDTDGSIKDEAKLTFDGSLLLVTGSAKLTDDLTVEGGDITLSNGMSISSATAGKLVLTGDIVEASGDLKVAGNDISGSAGLNISLESDGDVTIAGDLKVMGNELKSSAGNVVLELSGDDAYFKSDVHVAGKLFVDQDFVVKGTLTQIDTTNLRVEDAFIYLATGSLGTTDSGIVLHGGAGVGMDLVMGQDGGAGEFIFAKGNRAPDGDGAMANAVLVPAWMSELKVGDLEGSHSGSFAADANGAKLSAESGKDLILQAGSSGGELFLAADGETAISFMESGDSTDFGIQFPGMTLVQAIIAAGGGGNFKQDSFLPGAVAAGVNISFSSVGTLRSTSIADAAAKKVAMDVYLNGVRLAYGDDYEINSVTELDLEVTTMADDRLTVVIHNADPNP